MQPDRVASRIFGRFTRYSALSLVTVPAGYGLLLLARSAWDVNAGLLNPAVGTALTPPSCLLYRRFVWHERASRPLVREMFEFWQVVMMGAIVAGVFLGVADIWGARGAYLLLAGLLGQVALFVARYFWLDRFTFSAPENTRSTERIGSSHTFRAWALW